MRGMSVTWMPKWLRAAGAVMGPPCGRGFTPLLYIRYTSAVAARAVLERDGERGAVQRGADGARAPLQRHRQRACLQLGELPDHAERGRSATGWKPHRLLQD